jgi:hypothetical protein
VLGVPAPDMREHVRSLMGRTLRTVAQDHPNTIVDVTPRRVLVETQTGDRNHASLRKLQQLADRVFEGEEVEVSRRGRSAFYMAVLVTLPDVDFALNPRRVWLKDAPRSFDSEYAELFPEEDPVAAREGRVEYRRHRVRERSPLLRRMKKEAALRDLGGLQCEACGFDYAERYGPLGKGYIECHHKVALATADERETTLDDLALICASCHRMIHRSQPMLSVEELRENLSG